MIKRVLVSAIAIASISVSVFASSSDCRDVPTESQIRAALIAAAAADGEVGGLFHGTRMWGAVVNREGEHCAVAASTSDPTQVWPGSQAIAKSKAYTANAFSLDVLALSTAMLYTFTQPGHSLWSLGHSNGFDPQAIAPPDGKDGARRDFGKQDFVGGQIYFGGGVPLYNKRGKIVGGLGVSGDTSCADHEIAKRARHILGLDPPDGALADDITYSSKDGASVFTHPLCVNTWRNGSFIGNEAPAVGY